MMLICVLVRYDTNMCATLSGSASSTASLRATVTAQEFVSGCDDILMREKSAGRARARAQSCTLN